MKGGVPPTLRKARTGELTPPGISFCARAKSASDRVRFISRQLAQTFSVGGISFCRKKFISTS